MEPQHDSINPASTKSLATKRARNAPQPPSSTGDNFPPPPKTSWCYFTCNLSLKNMRQATGKTALESTRACTRHGNPWAWARWVAWEAKRTSTHLSTWNATLTGHTTEDVTCGIFSLSDNSSWFEPSYNIHLPLETAPCGRTALTRNRPGWGSNTANLLTFGLRKVQPDGSVEQDRFQPPPQPAMRKNIQGEERLLLRVFFGGSPLYKPSWTPGPKESDKYLVTKAGPKPSVLFWRRPHLGGYLSLVVVPGTRGTSTSSQAGTENTK